MYYMSLQPLNRDPKNMNGEYENMFKIPQHSSNKAFVSNPYIAGKCKCKETTCFSSTEGAKASDKGSFKVWSAQGKIKTIPNM